MKLLKIVFLPALLFVSYYFFTYVYSPSILTTGIGFKPTLSSSVSIPKDPFVLTSDAEYDTVFLCASEAGEITDRLRNSPLVARNDNESLLFKSFSAEDFEVKNISNNTYYYTFTLNDNKGKNLSYNIFNCNKVLRMPISINYANNKVLGYLGTLFSKDEFNDVIWLLDSMGVFKADNTLRSVKQVELLDTGDDFMRINTGIDSYTDYSKYHLYNNMYHQAFTYSKVTGALTSELVIDLIPRRNK